MAGVAFITGKRFVNGKEDSLFAIGTVQTDGFIYFNDEESFRCTSDKSYIQVFNVKRRRWVATSNVWDLNSIEFDVSGIIDAVGGLIGGGGSVSPNADVEKAVKWAIEIANDPSHGYDQTNRHGPNYDCSSLVSYALKAAGFDVPVMSTRTMRAELTARGWKWHAGQGNTAVGLLRGDILLNEGVHTEFYIGNNQNVGAHSNEFGGITGGDTGDQTGNEISITPYYSMPWGGFLRYEG